MSLLNLSPSRILSISFPKELMFEIIMGIELERRYTTSTTRPIPVSSVASRRPLSLSKKPVGTSINMARMRESVRILEVRGKR